MKLVVLESPYAGNIERNVVYAKQCVHDCLLRGEAPIASHLLFTQPGVLLDDDPNERALGMRAGHAWIKVCDYMVVYHDHGISKGMQVGIDEALRCGKEIEFRKIIK